jgi:hypothetical protein
VHVQKLEVAKDFEELTDVERCQAVKEAIEVRAASNQSLLLRIEHEDLAQPCLHLLPLLRSLFLYA